MRLSCRIQEPQGLIKGYACLLEILQHNQLNHEGLSRPLLFDIQLTHKRRGLSKVQGQGQGSSFGWAGEESSRLMSSITRIIRAILTIVISGRSMYKFHPPAFVYFVIFDDPVGVVQECSKHTYKNWIKVFRILWKAANWRKKWEQCLREFFLDKDLATSRRI